MSASSVSDELESRLSLALDPFEDMCAPRSQTTILARKAVARAPKSPVKRALMLRAPTSQTISDIALLQREKAQLSQQMNQLEAWVRGAEAKHGTLIKANRQMRCTLEKADKELELSRLKHDKLSQMLAAASSAQQAAEQKSRRLEIKFARSDKGHALMRSAKLQASVSDLEAQVSQLQGNCHHQGQLLASSQAKVVELHTALTQQAHKAGITDEQLLIDNGRMSSELESSRQYCQECEGQLSCLRQQSKLADEAAAEAAAEVAELQKRNADLSQRLQDEEQKHKSAVHQAAADTHKQQTLVSNLEAAVQSLASRGADELDETRRGYEERMHALRSEVEQQEVDKAALLDIVQDLEDKVSGQALETVEAALAAAQSQVMQLQSQLHQAQAKAAAMSHADAHVTQLRQQLQQQQAASEAQGTAVTELSGGFDRERASWQEERSSLLSHAKAADAESLRLHKTVESLKQDAQRALVESKQATQQGAVAQADLRSTRHQLKVLQQQALGLQPPPISPDSLHKREVSALKEQLDKLLGDLETKSHELHTTCTAHADMKHLLQQASDSHCIAEHKLHTQIAALRSDLELKTQQLQVESRALAEAESAVQSSAHMQGQGAAEGQLPAALRRDVDSSNSSLQAVQAELGANQQVLAGKQQEVELLQRELAAKSRELEGKQQELQKGAHSHAELNEVVPHASEEQSTAQLTALQDEVKELRGVRGACETLEQTVAHLRQRLKAEEARSMSADTLRMQLAALQDEVKELRGAQSMCEALEQTVAHLKQKLKAEEARSVSADTLRMQLATLQDEVKELRGVQRVCEALEQTVAQLKQRLRVEEVKGMSEGTLRLQLAALQDEVQELKGIRSACEALEQTVVHLKQRLQAEEAKQGELAGRLQVASRAPVELQQQLQQAQQQNQTLAHVLAERCEQAASHVEQHQQLSDMWQQLVSMQGVPAGATVQEQGECLKQQLAAVFDQLKLKDTQLSAMHQQLQAQHAQQTQRAEQAQHAQQTQRTQQAQHAQQAKDGQQLEWDQHTSQRPTQSAAQEAAQQSAAADAVSCSLPLSEAPSGSISPAGAPVASLHLRPSPGSSPSSGFMQPQLSTVSTICTDLVEPADSQTPRHRFVKQRVQQLQSRQSSPEKSLSSVSGRLNSPRAGLPGNTSTFRAGLLEGALDSSILEAAGSSPGRAGQPSSASKAAADDTDVVTVSSPSGTTSDFRISAIGSNQQQASSFHSILHSCDPGVTHQLARRLPCAPDFGDKAVAASAAGGWSRASPASQDGLKSLTALQRISPRSQISAQTSLSSLQLASDGLPARKGGLGSDPLQWGEGLEVGSPGLELPSDEDSSSEASDQAEGGRPGARAEARGAEAAEREDSAQFGPEASAMSLPGQEQAHADVAVSDVGSLSLSLHGDDGANSRPTSTIASSRPPTLKQQLSELHSSFKQMRSRYTPPHSRSLSTQSSLNGL